MTCRRSGGEIRLRSTAGVGVTHRREEEEVAMDRPPEKEKDPTSSRSGARGGVRSRGECCASRRVGLVPAQIGDDPRDLLPVDAVAAGGSGSLKGEFGDTVDLAWNSGAGCEEVRYGRLVEKVPVGMSGLGQAMAEVRSHLVLAQSGQVEAEAHPLIQSRKGRDIPAKLRLPD